MSERDRYEPGVPCWVTAMEPDPEATARFYGGLFGWEYVPGDNHLIAQLRGKDVAAIAPLAPGVDPPPSPDWITNVAVADAGDAAERAQSAGGRLVAGPLDFPSHRLAVLADPAGAVICAWESRTREGAQLVNEPGAWSMSRLDTPDVEGAAAFYGAVFGWTTETFDMGGTSITMFRLPGYVGGEPEQPVSREVVATMTTGVSARWNPDFWVHDVDEAAKKAEATGGAVVSAPADIGIGKTAVLADTAGVTFSVSRMNGK